MTLTLDLLVQFQALSLCCFLEKILILNPPGLPVRFQVIGYINRRGIKQLGISFGSTFLLLSYESSCRGPHP